MLVLPMYQVQGSSVQSSYVDADFVGLWVNNIPQDPICVNSRTGFVVTFYNFTLLWVSKLQRNSYLLTE